MVKGVFCTIQYSLIIESDGKFHLKKLFAEGESGIPKGYTLCPPEAKSPDNPAEGGFRF